MNRGYPTAGGIERQLPLVLQVIFPFPARPVSPHALTLCSCVMELTDPRLIHSDPLCPTQNLLQSRESVTVFGRKKEKKKVTNLFFGVKGSTQNKTKPN